MSDEKILTDAGLRSEAGTIHSGYEGILEVRAALTKITLSHQTLRQRGEELGRENEELCKLVKSVVKERDQQMDVTATYRELQAVIPTPDQLEGMRKWMSKRMDLDNNSHVLIIEGILHDKIKAYRVALDKLKGTE